MNGTMIGIEGIIIMLVALFVLRMPAGFVMALFGFIGIAYMTSFDAALTTTGTEFWNLFSGYGLSVIPMFILLGEIIFHAGYSDQLFHTSYKWVGHRKGGLAISTILACAGFSAICGSNTATAATMSAVAIPTMKKYNYNPTLTAGAVSAGSTLGVMIPPSIVLVVYGIYTGQSIGKLFFGTLIPGIILTLLMTITVILICKKHPTWGPEGPVSPWSERIKSIPDIIDVVALFLVTMTALMSGVVTATEAAATSCFLGLILCMVRRKLPWKKFCRAVYDTLRITCLVFMIIAGASIFGRFLTITRLPYEIASYIGGSDWPYWIILSMMLLCYIIGGCIMDALAFLLVSLPIFFPLIQKMGYDPIWFGEVLCLVTTMGAITPPIGISCFIVSGMSEDIPIEQVFKGALYYIPAYIITLILMFLFPYWMVSLLANLAR